jgi:hypothetical protein
VFVLELYATEPATPPADPLKVNVAPVIVEAFIASLKVAEIDVFMATPVALLFGETELTAGAVMSLNVAVHVRGPPIVTVAELLVPEQAPDHPAKPEPAAGTAVRVTFVPEA